LYSYNEGKVSLKERKRATKALEKQQFSHPKYQCCLKYPAKSELIRADIVNR
jgi:hypothetical protein